MAQTVFIKTDIDPQQLALKQEIRQTIPFPLNGKRISGVGANEKMNAYVSGLFQPINYINTFDSVKPEDVSLSNYIGINTAFDKVTLESCLDKPCYCHASGPSFNSELFARIDYSSFRQPTSVSSQSPYFASRVDAGKMNFLSIFGVTKVPNYRGYIGFGLYSDCVLRYPGVKNFIFPEGGARITAFDMMTYAVSYSDNFSAKKNNGNVNFSETINTSTQGCCVYIKFLVFNENMELVQACDFNTGYFDQRIVDKSTSPLIPRGYMPSVFDVDGGFSSGSYYYYKTANTTEFNYVGSENYQGYVINFDGASLKRIENDIKNGKVSSDAVKNELLYLISNQVGVTWNFGQMAFKPPVIDRSDKSEMSTMQYKYIDWLTNDMGSMELLHISLFIGCSTITNSILLFKGDFYTENLPEIKIKTGDTYGEMTWTYPMAYSFTLYDSIGNEGICVNRFVNNYVSTISNGPYLYSFFDENSMSSRPVQFLFNGASYIVDSSGRLLMSLQGAAPTIPFNDYSFRVQGGGYSKYLDYDVSREWIRGMYPFSAIPLEYKSTPDASVVRKMAGNGGKFWLWLPPTGIKEKSLCQYGYF